MSECTGDRVDTLVRNLVQTWEDGPSLLTRVEELMLPGANRRPGSAGKRAHSPAPLAVHVLDLLVLVERESLAWEKAFRSVLDMEPIDRGRSQRACRAALAELPRYAYLLGMPAFVDSVERDLSFWHARCLALMGVSPLEQRYKITEDAAGVIKKSPNAFRVWAHRNGLEPVGYLPITFRGGVTRPAVWDMREVARVVKRRVTVPANG